jgi:predicted RNase H-like nuclease (RuvC/YqgF family)
MKSPVLWVIIALLVGISVFGILKSLELTARNVALSHSVTQLKSELDITQTALKASRQALGDSYLTNAELEGRIAKMDARLNEQAMNIKGYLAKISAMSQKLQETAQANVMLSASRTETANQLMRERFMAREMRMKLSSITELKKAIKELRVSLKRSPRAKPAAVRKKRMLELSEPKEIVDEPLKGNAGFVVKDGKSTFEGLVDICVVPEEGQ